MNRYVIFAFWGYDAKGGGWEDIIKNERGVVVFKSLKKAREAVISFDRDDYQIVNLRNLKMVESGSILLLKERVEAEFSRVVIRRRMNEPDKRIEK